MSERQKGHGSVTHLPRQSTIGATCPECQTIHGSNAVAAVGRFDPSGPRGYRGDGGPLRATRAEAFGDVCRNARSRFGIAPASADDETRPLPEQPEEAPDARA